MTEFSESPLKETPDQNLQDIRDELRGIGTQVERISEEVKREAKDIKGKFDLLHDIQKTVTGLSDHVSKQVKENRFHVNMNYCIWTMVAGVSVASLGYAQGWSDVIWAGTGLSFLGIVVTFIIIFKGIRQRRGG